MTMNRIGLRWLLSNRCQMGVFRRIEALLKYSMALSKYDINVLPKDLRD